MNIRDIVSGGHVDRYKVYFIEREVEYKLCLVGTLIGTHYVLMNAIEYKLLKWDYDLRVEIVVVK